MTKQDPFLTAVDRVAALPVDPATFPRDTSPEFQAGAVEVVRQIARLRFVMDGGDLEEFDSLGLEDTTSVIALDDLREFIVGFHTEGDQPRYSACAAVFDWLVSTGYRPPQG